MEVLSIYKGEKSLEMSNKKKSQNDKDTNGDDITKISHVKNKIKSKKIHFILDKIIFPILPTLFLAGISWFNGFFRLPEQVSNVQSDIKDLNSRTNNLEKNIEFINGKLNVNKDFDSGLNDIIDKGYDVADSNSVMLDVRYIGSISVDKNTDQITLKDLSTESDKVVAVTIDGRKTFKANEIIDKRVIVPYKENGYCIIFYGKYNKNYHWDGICTTNVYKDKKLYLITRAKYNDGHISTYKQIIQDKDKKVWDITEREHKDKYDIGYTYTYSRNNDYQLKLKFNNITKKDILTYKKFRKKIETTNKKLSYYYGQTANGTYNDSTGNAFRIQFDEDEKLEIFYNGNFKDGILNDHKYDHDNPADYAWQIVHDNVGYFYFKGDFENNVRSENLPKSPYISLQKAKDLVAKFDYDFSNLWYE